MKNRRYTLGLPVLAFAVTILIELAIFKVCHILPFGVHTVIRGDMSNQFMDLFSYLQKNLSTPGNLFYSTSMALGSNFFGVLTYYLASPLNLLVAFCSGAKLPLFFSLLTILKMGLLSFTMAIFLSQSRLLNRHTQLSQRDHAAMILAFSVIFSFMSFIIQYKEIIMWLDSIILLPLIVLGLERLLTLHKPWLYFFTLLGSILFSYYLGFMICLFIALIYLWGVVYKLCTGTKVAEIWRQSRLFLLMSFSAGLSSAFVLLPSFLSTANITKAKFPLTFKPMYNPIEFLGRLFNGYASYVNSPKSPLIYVGSLVLLLITLFFLDRHIPRRHKLAACGLLVALFLSTWLNTLYALWHSFTLPNGYTHRESFLVSFVLIALAYYAALRIDVSVGQLLRALIILAVLGGIAAVAKGTIASSIGKNIAVLVLTLFLCGVYSFLIWYYQNDTSALAQKGLLLVALLAVLEISVSNWHMQKNFAYTAQGSTGFSQFYAKTNPAVTHIQNTDNGAYRVGASFQSTDNNPLLFNYRGLSSYVSQQSDSLTDFLSSTGYYQKLTWQRWANYNNGSTLAMDSLLGVKYVLNSSDAAIGKKINISETFGYNSQQAAQYTDKIWQKHQVQIYRNNQAFPLVFPMTGNGQVPKQVYWPTNNPFVRINQVWSAVTGTTKHLYSGEYAPVVKHTKRALTYEVTPVNTGRAYIYIPQRRGEKVPGPMKVTFEGQTVAYLYRNEGENGVITLGHLQKGKTVRFKIEYIKKQVKHDIGGEIKRLPYIDVENQSMIQTYQRHIQKTSPVSKLKIQGNHVRFESQSAKTQRLLITLPYESHWQAKIDGKNVPLKKSVRILTSLTVPKGKHSILLTYHVPGLGLGVSLSVIGWLLALLYLGFVLVRRYRPKHVRFYK